MLSNDQRYARCEALILASEGGSAYTNSPKDRGGPTKYGVTLKALSDHRGHACTADDVKGLIEAEASDIYRAVYWNGVHGDDLPAGVDYMALDAAVNTGRGRAAELLQRAVGAVPDRAIGPSTLALVKACDPTAIIHKMADARDDYYRSLPDFPTFGRGWLNRLNAVRAQSLSWALQALQTA